MIARRCAASLRSFSASGSSCQQVGHQPCRNLSRLTQTPKPHSNSADYGSVHRGLRPSIVRPVLFCTFASGSAFLGAAAFSHERSEQEHAAFRWRRHPNSQTILGKAKEAWNALTPEQKAVYGIIGLNIGVFGLWRIPSLQGLMGRLFLLPLPPLRMQPAFSALTSTFSHASIGHLAFNMIAFSSFGGHLAQILGAEQFVAVFLTAGMVSSLTSYAGRLRSLKGGHSLGASGAVYACFAAIALLYPAATAQFIFLPGVPIQMGTLLPVLMGTDILGVLLGWRYLDHLGHLGGAAFGLLYTLYGHHLWSRREQVLRAVGWTDEK
ncbi:hypothetical protein CVIRNUC_001463 [Coccomyxa viridis]|uniref:Peptidase S54 rhomboid domain-containing protein n=1 Tax=Coccomyxa viridis TaxID=1274662 RepID=A0AAV1HTD6_9CHLO|nr:hypothetical protein CVIRNUC_001463 [Coccomyxa viridis]